VYSVSSDTLVRLASGLAGHCVKKQCGLVGLCLGGRTALDIHLSRVRTGVAAMRQDCNYYQLDTTKLGRKKGVKNVCLHERRVCC
jgi:dienelactone hydrolase